MKAISFSGYAACAGAAMITNQTSTAAKAVKILAILPSPASLII